MTNNKSLWTKIGIGAVVLIIFLTIAKSKGWIGGSDAIKVSVEKAALHDIVETVSANGKVQPEVEVKISADVSGEVVDMFVKEGDVVKKGTLLCRIKPDIYVSSLDQATANRSATHANYESSKSRLAQSQSQLTKADLNFTRNKKLYDDGAISASDFESVKSAYEVAKAEVDAATQSVSAADYNLKSTEASMKQAQENLNKTAIYAPVDGTISKLSVEKGERVVGTSQMAGTEIMRIANLNEMEVSVDVSENDIVRVVLNDTAAIDIDAYLGRKFSGIVTEVANSANVTGTTSTDQVTNFTVKVRVLHESYSDLLKDKPASYSPFRPGMSATVEIRTKKVTNVIALPIQAVTTRDTSRKEDKMLHGNTASNQNNSSAAAPAKETNASALPKECVFVIEKGKAKIVYVKTGIQDNLNIEITEGIKAGEEVISGPYNAISKILKEGAAVQVVAKEELFDKEKGK